MPRSNQTESGKAWEYGLAHIAADIFSKPLITSPAKNTAEGAYNNLEEQERTHINKAAGEAVRFLRKRDKALSKVQKISMQSDNQGKDGDVRDVIIHTDTGDVGISAKHRHKAIKHPRLSATIDFGQDWYGRKCSSNYWEVVKPIFSRLKKEKEAGRYWRELPDKEQEVYAPIMEAFTAEIKGASAENLLRHMLGQHDYYKVVKDNGDVLLQSFNLNKTLGWGKTISMPNRIIEVARSKPSTAIITFDGGWALKFRVHNAEREIVPSVKFDVTLVGTPEQANHQIRYR